jgi:cAMP phosphodiesterase
MVLKDGSNPTSDVVLVTAIILNFRISSGSETNLFVLFSPSYLLKNLVKMQMFRRERAILMLGLDGVGIGTRL